MIRVQIIFHGYLELLRSFQNRDPLKSVLGGGVAGVAHFITGHGVTQSNRNCYFCFFGVVLASTVFN